MYVSIVNLYNNNLMSIGCANSQNNIKLEIFYGFIIPLYPKIELMPKIWLHFIGLIKIANFFGSEVKGNNES